MFLHDVMNLFFNLLKMIFSKFFVRLRVEPINFSFVENSLITISCNA